MKALFGAAAGSVVAATVILLLSWTAYFSELNSTAYDFTLRLAGPVPVKSPTLIVAIGDESLRRIGRWPWSREKLAQLIDGIEAGGPRTIAVDLLLDDKTSPGPDAALAASIGRAHSIVLAAHMEQGTGVWLQPDPMFLQPNVRLGHVHTDPDFDGINRRIFSVKVSTDGRPMPAFAIQALRSAGVPFSGDSEPSARGVEVVRPQAVNIRFAGDNNSFRHIPAWRILDGGEDAAQFAGRIVLIGFTAEGGLSDQWFTPFAETGNKTSGVEIHAHAIETLYAGRAIIEAGAGFMVIGLALYFLLLWWLDRRFEGRPFYIAALLTGPGVLGVSWFLMKYVNVWAPFPPFWAALVAAAPGLEVAKIVRVNRNLDRKLERLSKNWLSALNWYEPQSAESLNERRETALTRGRRGSRWKLDAIDFFDEELMRFLSFNNTILAAIEDVIIVCDAAGRVVYQNPAAKRLGGYRRNPGAASTYLSAALDGREVSLTSDTIQFAPACDGRAFYNVTVTRIADAGAVIRLHDATAQHELGQAKNDMVSLVSHELRTPLTSIRGYSDMLLKYNLVDARGKEFLATIIDESARLNQLIQSFLDIAYIESGRQKIDKTDFEIGPVLADMVAVIGPIAASRQIQLQAPEDLNGMTVRADRLLLYQALSNLVTNAVKYSPAETCVRIAVANGSGVVRFRVADQGYGIPAAETAKIFEKFYRRGNKETREQSGFGLGLAFVKEVALRHGGDVAVESAPGKGSVFTLWIPAI